MLKEVKGSFAINSTKYVNCDDVSSDRVKGPLYYCSTSDSNKTFPLSQKKVSSKSSEDSTDSREGSDDGSHASLSQGGKIGLGVGLGVGIPVLITIAAVVVCLRRRPPQPMATLPAEVPDSEREVYQLPGSRREMTAELDNGIVPELDGAKSEPSELPGSNRIIAEQDAPSALTAINQLLVEVAFNDSNNTDRQIPRINAITEDQGHHTFTNTPDVRLSIVTLSTLV